MPTFLLFRGHRSVVEQCCVRLHSTSNNVAPAHAHYIPRIHTNTCEQEINMASEMKNVPESFVFLSKVPTRCDLLRASANIAQQETTLLGPTMLRVVASVCTGLNPAAINVYIKNHLTFNIQGNGSPLSVWQQETKGPTRLVTFIKCNSIYNL